MFYCKILITTLVLFFCFGCNSAKNNSQTALPRSQTDTAEIPKDLLVTLERTQCYGVCPAYKLSVKADGAVTFEGLKYTKVTGKAEGKISEEKLRQLIKEFENADYFNLNDKYDYDNCNSMTDMPTASTSIQINGQQKSVKHYHGCVGDTADLKEKLSNLTKLENKIDEIAETKRWIGGQK